MLLVNIYTHSPLLYGVMPGSRRLLIIMNTLLGLELELTALLRDNLVITLKSDEKEVSFASYTVIGRLQ